MTITIITNQQNLKIITFLDLLVIISFNYCLHFISLKNINNPQNWKKHVAENVFNSVQEKLENVISIIIIKLIYSLKLS